MHRYYFNIDVLGMGACNLRCPTCPVGNSREVKNPGGMMSPETLDAVLTKALSECEIAGVSLFNWTEPLLHPRLPELVRVVKDHGLRCDLSSNLNKLNNIEAVLAENPDSFRISNSGFTQEVYGVSHRGGDVEVVKQNMVRLQEARQVTQSSTPIHLLYHRYLANLEDEVRMKRFCDGLGFEFVPVWAFFMPVEKVLALVENDPSLATLSQEDLETVDLLLLPLRQALKAAQKYRDRDCTFQVDQVTMDYAANVQLCCATYDASRFTIGNFLETPLASLQAMRFRHSLCDRCVRQGVHVYYAYQAPEFTRLAVENLENHFGRPIAGYYSKLFGELPSVGG